MKKHITIFLTALCCIGTIARAQDDDVLKAAAAAAQAIYETEETKEVKPRSEFWNKFITMDIGFNQTGLTNWAAGGYNTLNLNTGLDAQANYAKGLMSWTNRLQMNYGFLWSADKVNLLQKSNDRIYLESRWAYKTASHSKWDYTASFDFRTQFSKSFDKYVQDPETQEWKGTLRSSIFAPAYANIALGLAWNPTTWFNVNIAPLTGGVTICTIPELRKTYGMHLKEEGLDAAIGDNYFAALFQFGAQIKTNLKASLNDVLKYETQLVLFTDYLNKPFSKFRVNWDNKINWQIAKFFKVGVDTWLIYDPAVILKEDTKARVQFKEFVSINFTYTISNKK